jgi:hypothetical protein
MDYNIINSSSIILDNSLSDEIIFVSFINITTKNTAQWSVGVRGIVFIGLKPEIEKG